MTDGIILLVGIVLSGFIAGGMVTWTACVVYYQDRERKNRRNALK